MTKITASNYATWGFEIEELPPDSNERCIEVTDYELEEIKDAIEEFERLRDFLYSKLYEVTMGGDRNV